MSYTALYRKFRPDNFEDVKGQDHIVGTLRNQIKAERIGHAYLFCGTRGTGKTSVAKIFAKAVNCEQPKDGSPCGECRVCKAIAAQASMNVMEIDAASNNGVDNIREIRDEVEYSPTEGKYKVYIIDEVHMLSIGAFNALLKTLEEPPSYVIFILATTEAHKLPVTILSRCQRYDFHRISIDAIAGRMQELLAVEQQEYEEKAIRYIAKMADGSMRDALSLLDQCIAFYIGQTLTYERVLDVLGAVDTEVFARMFLLIRNQDIVGLMAMTEEMMMQGRELTQFVNDFTWYLRNLLLIQGSDNMEDALDMSTEQLQLLKETAKGVKADSLIRYIRIFSDLSNQIKYASQKRILVEVALIKLCKPQMENDYSSLQERIEQIEKKLENGNFTVLTAQQKINAAEDNIEKEPKRPAALPDALPEDVRKAAEEWNHIIQLTSGATANILRKGRLSLGEGNQLELVFEDDMSADWMNQEQRKQELQQLIEQQIGKKIELRVRYNDTGLATDDVFINLQQLVNMPIEIEEE